jgi:hypothetical protein
MGNENWENDRFVFEGRAEAMKFRKFMIDLFEGRVEMPYNPVATAKKSIASLPTFDKVVGVRRILTNNLPNNKFTDENIKEMIVRLKRYTDGVTKLIGDDVTPEVVVKIIEEITTMIDEMTETQYRLFVENSIKRIKLNEFYR